MLNSARQNQCNVCSNVEYRSQSLLYIVGGFVYQKLGPLINWSPWDFQAAGDEQLWRRARGDGRGSVGTDQQECKEGLTKRGASASHWSSFFA